MPTTLTALVVIVVGIVPGVLGETIYQSVAGSDWRESEWERAVRIIAISVAGLVVTLGVAAILKLGIVLRVPSVERGVFLSEIAPWIAVYSAHFAASSVVGLVAAFASRAVSRVGRIGAYPDTWDVFARRLVDRHWVVVTLSDGNSYAGMIEKADISVKAGERDLILAEPARYDDGKNQYITTQYQYLYLPAAMVASVGVYYDPAVDERVTLVNQPLFAKSHEQET